jgi:sulfonate transport system substrate-binding protein
MIKVHIGGVPEHFNLAWHLAIENKSFEKAGFNIQWHDIPGGTGEMCNRLRKGELNIAIALTEGVVADILQGNPSKIVQFYVNSPLRWGIFVHAHSTISQVSDMPGHKYAISRYKSGSHLMPFVQAQKFGYSLGMDDFVVVGNLDGARQALSSKQADLFMWEKYTTKPLVDAGEFKMIGECSTPWPCFVVAVSDNFLASHQTELIELLNIINLQCWLMMNNAQTPEMVAKRYDIKLQDAKAWYSELEYACQPNIDPEYMQIILDRLHQVGIIPEIPPLHILCHIPKPTSKDAVWLYDALIDAEQ